MQWGGGTRNQRAVALTSATQGMTALHLHWSTKATIGDIDRAVDDAFRTLGYPVCERGAKRGAVMCTVWARLLRNFTHWIRQVGDLPCVAPMRFSVT